MMENRIEKIQEYLKANPKDNFLRHALALEYIKNDDDNAASFEQIPMHILYNEVQ
jgi:thioredoxin-like negative regulator of GroEL